MELMVLWLASIPDVAVPYALAALGLIIAERAGVLSLGAEGLMLVGALFAIGAQLRFGDTGLSLLLAMGAAAVVSLLFAAMVVWLRVNQVIAGLALVFFCQGLTGLLGTLLGWTNQPVTSTGAWALWPLSALPGIGRLFVQNPVAWATPLVFIAVWAWLMRSGAGLRLRAVGENRRPPTPPASAWPVCGWRPSWPARCCAAWLAPTSRCCRPSCGLPA